MRQWRSAYRRSHTTPHHTTPQHNKVATNFGRQYAIKNNIFTPGSGRHAKCSPPDHLSLGAGWQSTATQADHADAGVFLYSAGYRDPAPVTRRDDGIGG